MCSLRLYLRQAWPGGNIFHPMASTIPSRDLKKRPSREFQPRKGHQSFMTNPLYNPSINSIGTTAAPTMPGPVWTPSTGEIRITSIFATLSLD